ncbi:conserved protein, unknown function [Hepatocystis sp. ex Piliocolobus tephrosceles]|nr:conserved protein, unknown function [Hepatocystis sp. ex Piliocolobus tephrosceles]
MDTSCLSKVEHNGSTLTMNDNIPYKLNNMTSQLINVIKKKSNHVRMLYNALNGNNKELPLYIFVKDENEKKRQILKDLYLTGKLHFLQGHNNPLSKYYLAVKNRHVATSILLDEKLKKERDFINNLTEEDKTNYVKGKITKYENLRINAQQLYSNLEKKLNSLEEIIAILKK